MVKKYDQCCTRCDWSDEISGPPGCSPLCPVCQSPTQRLYVSGYGVIGDDIPGGMVVENLGHAPVTVYSKSQLKSEAEKRGLVQSVRHVGSKGSDKSPHTTRWV